VKGVLIVAAREISERKRIFLAAAVASLLPFLAPLLPNIAHGDVSQARAVLAMIFLVAFGIGTAIVLGSTILVRDLAERRFSFFFSRPISSLAIWGGKILAAFLLASGAALLCALPTWIAAPGTGLVERSLAPVVTTFGLGGLFFGGLLLFVGLFHAAAVSIRSRSPWLVVDIVLLIACSIVMGRSWLFLTRAEVSGPRDFLNWAPPVLLVLLLAAGGVQVAVGRTDLKRGHGAQSLTIWGVLLPLTLAGAGATYWLLTPAPSDLLVISEAKAAPAGEWIAISGPARHRGDARATFLLNSKTAAGLLTGLGWSWGGEPVFSPDGRVALWYVLERGADPSVRLWRADLEEAHPRPRATTITALGELSFSPSGRRIAILEANTLSIVEMDSEKTLAAVRIPGDARNFFFFEENTVRLYPRWAGPMRHNGMFSPLYEFRIADRKLEKTGEVPRPPDERLLIRYEAGGSRLLALEGRRRLTLRDGRSGRLLSTLSESRPINVFLPLLDESVVTCGVENRSLTLRRVSLDGRLLGGVSLPDYDSATLTGLDSGGRLLVSARPSSNPDGTRKNWDLLAIDTTSDLVVSQTPRLLPLSPFAWFFSPTLPPATEFGPPRTKYFLDEEGALVFFDTATGERRQILPKPH
jgi:hypothetical protein